MNITSFRRKMQSPQPLTVLRQLYYDYSNQTKSFRSKIVKNDEQFKLVRTNSAEQMTEYLKKHSLKDSNLCSTQNKTALIINDQHQNAHQQSHSTTLNSSRNGKISELQDHCEKRGYFKNIYTKSHPFFRKHKAIKRKSIDIQSALDGQISEEFRKNMYRQTDVNLKTPTQRVDEIKKLKITLLQSQSKKREHCKLLRLNYIVDTCYSNRDCQEYQLKRIGKELSCDKRRFLASKENIFPGSTGNS